MSTDHTIFHDDYRMPVKGGYVNVYPPGCDSTGPRAYGACWTTRRIANMFLTDDRGTALYRIHVIPKR